MPDALAPGPAIVEVSGVSKRFGTSQALSDVSMRVPVGDLRALVGRNGAGKSTLVGVLTGIISPDVGRIQFGGEEAPGIAERQKWRDRVACVYQKSTLVPTLTVAENLLLNAQPTGGLRLDPLGCDAAGGGAGAGRLGHGTQRRAGMRAALG